MALKQVFDIRIDTELGTILIDRIHEIEIESDWQKMSDTGVLKLPRKCLIADSNRKLLELVKTSCKVVVKLGYMAHNIPVGERLVTEFIGYVAKTPYPGAPVEIELEDEMFVLKRKNILAHTFRGKASVLDVVKYVAGEYELDVVDADLGEDFIVRAGSASQALRQLEDVYGLKSFFRLIPDKRKPEGARQVLVVGKPYNSIDLLALTPADDILYGYRKNVISSDLKCLSSNDARIKVKATSKIPKAKDITVEVGDDDGTVINMKPDFNGLPKATLEKLARAHLNRFKVDRFNGGLTSFGFPYVRHGRIIKYSDWRFGAIADKTRYFIDAVKLKAGVNGYRRTVTLGWVVSSQNQSRIK